MQLIEEGEHSSEKIVPLQDRSGGLRVYLLLSAATILCLIPFSGRAFHLDDTLFVWVAKQIVSHPLNPYGFPIIWEAHQQSVSDITQNPPLASYYAALLGRTFGWSEWTLHLGFLLPAVALTLGTYRLAQKFTGSAQLAAWATLLTPGFLISACSVMCDVMMLAFWVWAAFLWIEGLEESKLLLLIASASLIALCALTKYFGIALVPLLFVYAIAKQRRIGAWALCMLIPIATLLAYQLWTRHLYGHGLLSGAAGYAIHKRDFGRNFWAVTLLYGIDFIGGCALPGLIAGFFLLPRKHVWIGSILAFMASVSLMIGAVDLEGHFDNAFVRPARGEHWMLIGTELTLCLAGGFFALSLAWLDCWEIRNSESLLLALWLGGTLIFATFVNWTLNARSILPLVPAVGILLARRFERIPWPSRRALRPKLAAALVVSGAISIWLAAADSELGDSARFAANMIAARFQRPGDVLWFGGHWGFQYYMEGLGARPVDWDHSQFGPDQYVVIPHNNTWARTIYPRYIASEDSVTVPIHAWATTISWQLGAGFYDSFWGPMPFAFGPVPAEKYTIVRLAPNVSGIPLSEVRPDR